MFLTVWHDSHYGLPQRFPQGFPRRAPGVVGDSIVDETQEEKHGPAKCVPYVSEYTDCTEDNKCDPGCTKCTCSNQEQWNCQSVRDCSEVSVLEEEPENTLVDDSLFDAAIDKLELEMKAKDQADGISENPVVPTLKAKTDASAELLDIISRYDVVDKLKEYSRKQRSLVKKIVKNEKASIEKTNKNLARLPRSNSNNTVKFYSTVDDLNENTLKNSNNSGTLLARRMESTVPDVARRSNVIDNKNNSSNINLSQPKILNHITDNKIDSVDQENNVDIDNEKLDVLLGNKTRQSKDKDLSKLVVNELKNGVEIIGDKNAPVTSNITFTSQNDTLTAMAFIAGNLLNKLWNMEKDVSGSSLEIDDMKHEKISDLVDLFKEPLNLRQEEFLKHALEQLSNAIGKDRNIKNISLCQNIEEASKLTGKDTDKEDKTVNPLVEEPKVFENITINKDDKNNQIATTLALSKINNVLDLMKKFEKIQKNMSKINSGIDSKKVAKIANNKRHFPDAVLTKDETNTFNIFGDILDKITKMLMPQKSYRKMNNQIKSKNVLTNDHHFKNKVMNMSNVDLANMTVSVKDKLVLDYITHINSNPNCVLNKISPSAETRILPSIEGNILLNLSEFFKIKSFADLLNVLKTENKGDKINTLNISTVTKVPTKMSTIISTKKAKNIINNKKKFESTKVKLKSHLKTIIEDIIELQNAKGVGHRGNLRIADALPCIYNIINAGKDIYIKKENTQNKMTDNVVNVLKNLKHTLKTDQTRRSGTKMQVRPKSAVVLERVIKNIITKSKLVSRRQFDSRLHYSLEDFKNLINKMTNITSIYKNELLFVEIPAAEKIVLLKVLQRDTNNYIKALNKLKSFYNKFNQLNMDEYSDVYEFVANVAKNITLTKKVLKKMENSKRHIISEARDINKISNTFLLNNTLERFSGNDDNDNDMKISRQQIISHLIKNRIQIYMKLKEAKDLDEHNDINYNIAKKIIFHLDNGNFNLANELYKVLMMQKNNTLDSPASKNYPVPIRKIAESQDIMSRLQSLMRHEDPMTDTQMKLMDQDNLIKQLINLKKLKI